MDGIMGIHSKIGFHLVISGYFTFVASSYTFGITCSLIDNSINMYEWSCLSLDIYMK